MPDYSREAKKLFVNNEIDTTEFINRVWQGAKSSARDEHVVEKATEVFLTLYEAGKGKPVKGSEIFARAQFSKYHNTGSHGLWPWLKEKGNADVIERLVDNDGDIAFKTRPQFYIPLFKTVMGRDPRS